MSAREATASSLAGIKTRRVEWIYEDRIPLRTGTILAGQGGIAKSTIISDIIAKATRGELPGSYFGSPISVGVISPEDDDESVLVPRLIAAGANLPNIFNLRVTVTESDRSWLTLPNIADDLPAIGNLIRTNGIKLLVVDPLVSIMSGNSISQSDVRRNFDPLSSLASELEFAVLAVAHFGKSGERAGDRLSGSHAFRDVARSLIVAAIDEETGNRVLTVEKSNYSPAMPSDAYAIDSQIVRLDDGYEQSIGRARLIGSSAITVQELMDRERDTSGLSGDMQRVIEEVERHPNGASAAEIVTALTGQVSDSSARKSLNRAADRGYIVKQQRGHFAPLSNVPTVQSVPIQDNKDKEDNFHIEKNCPNCGLPSHPANASAGYLHPGCEVAA